MARRCIPVSRYLFVCCLSTPARWGVYRRNSLKGRVQRSQCPKVRASCFFFLFCDGHVLNYPSLITRLFEYDVRFLRKKSLSKLKCFPPPTQKLKFIFLDFFAGKTGPESPNTRELYVFGSASFEFKPHFEAWTLLCRRWKASRHHESIQIVSTTTRATSGTINDYIHRGENPCLKEARK